MSKILNHSSCLFSIFLLSLFSCSSNSKDSVQWNVETPQNNESPSEDTASDDTLVDTGQEMIETCDADLEVHIPSWEAPPAFGNDVHNEMTIHNPCPFPVVLLGSPQNWFATSNFSISQIPPNHIEADSTIAIKITFTPSQSGVFESVIHIPTDYKEIHTETEIDVLDALELVLVGDGGLRVPMTNYGETQEDIDIQYENLLTST